MARQKLELRMQLCGAKYVKLHVDVAAGSWKILKVTFWGTREVHFYDRTLRASKSILLKRKDEPTHVWTRAVSYSVWTRSQRLCSACHQSYALVFSGSSSKNTFCVRYNTF